MYSLVFPWNKGYSIVLEINPTTKRLHNLSMKAYEDLSRIQKQILGFLAIHAMGLELSHLHTHLQSIQSIKNQIRNLQEQNFIVEKNEKLFCREDIAFLAVKEMVLTDNFLPLAEQTLQILPFSHAMEEIHQANPKAYIRCMQMALFMDFSVETMKKIYQEWQQIHAHAGQTPQTNAAHLFLSIFHSPFQPRILETVSQEKRPMVLNLVLSEMDIYQSPDKAFLAHLSDVFTGQNILSAYKAGAMNLFLQMGMFDQYQRILNSLAKNSPVLHAIYQGSLLFLQDDTRTALEHFRQGFSQRKEIALLKTENWEPLPLIFYLFTLLKAEDQKRNAHLVALIEEDTESEPEHPLLIGLCHAAFSETNSESGKNQEAAPEKTCLDAEFLDYCSGIYEKKPLYWLFQLMFMAWKNKTMAQEFGPVLEDFFNRMTDAQYTWIAAETSMLLAYLDVAPKKFLEQGRSIHQKMGTTTILNAYRPQPVWEKQLQALASLDMEDEISCDVQAIRSQASQRIIWVLQWPIFPRTETSPDAPNLSRMVLPRISPRLQKKNKKGRWTKGRPMALKTLYHNRTSMPGITKCDQEICSAIREYTYKPSPSQAHYKNSQTEYFLDETTALKALMKHDLVFVEEQGELLPISLVPSEPEIRLQTNEDGIFLTTFPPSLPPGTNMMLHRESLGRVRIIEITPRHQKIFDIIGQEGLQAPADKIGDIKTILSPLLSVMQISSDIAMNMDHDNPAIEADPRPHALITPAGNGIFLEFRVRPLQKQGSYYLPGTGSRHVCLQEADVPMTISRNLEEETRLMGNILDVCPALARRESTENQWNIPDPDAALEILFELKNCQEPMLLEWSHDKAFSLRNSIGFEGLSLGIEKHRNWFKATGQLDIDKDLTLDLKEVLSLMDQATGRFIPLDDGSFIELTQQLKDRLEELKLSLSLVTTPSGKKDLLFSPLAHGIVEEVISHAGKLTTDEAWQTHCKAMKQMEKPRIPGSLKAVLRSYQKEGFYWLGQLMNWNMGACLADDMGLGKTVQALSALLLCADKGPCLVVAPVSVMANWEEECKKFTPTLTPKLFHAENRREVIQGIGAFDLVITSYGLLQTEEKTLQSIEWQAVILDEAQAIKNMNTKRSRAAMGLNAKFRLITTGTPLENHLGELWTLFHFINPGLLGSWNTFRKNFAIPIERDHNKIASNCLKKLIQPFVLRRLKTQVLTELPEKTDITIHVEMSREETALYEAQRLQSIEKIETMTHRPVEQQRFEILAELSRLRQLCCHPDMIVPDSGINSSKLAVFSDIIRELLPGHHKVLVFSQFVKHLDLLRDFLDTQGIVYQYLDGSTPARQRRQRIEAFQTGQGNLFLISLKAGGTGLNLTAADYVIHMDPWWNPAVEDQASDRAHRIGQTRPVTVYRLVLKGTIEEQIIELHREKRNLAEDLLSGTDLAGKISSEKLLELLKTPIPKTPE